MTILQWLFLLMLGSIMGMLGQAIRTLLGLKTVGLAAFDWKLAAVNMFYGAVSGSLACLLVPPGDPTSTTLLTLVSAGYAGTDFIEGIMKSRLPT
jgi:hypothetical protein